MARSVRAYTKRNRPPEKGTMVGVRLQPDMLARLDAWIAQRPKPLSRPAAIRAFIVATLDLMGEK